ncbi:MarR family winged helix-turn-helix transcriptional regulator [Sphingomonas sp. MMS24-JH45]
MRRTFFDAALRPMGITRAQWWALGNIFAHAEEGMIETELARVLDMGKVSVGGLIDRLEAAGLVHRAADAVDRRMKRIFITDKGYEVLAEISKVGERLDAILFADIDKRDLGIAVDTIARIKNNVRTALKAAPDTSE